MSKPATVAISRRRFCRLLAATPFVALPTGSIPANTKDAADLLYTQATQFLRKGLRFERAAEYLTLAAEKDPDNPAHPLALGCAYASRAVSLAYAAGAAHQLMEERANFEGNVLEWEQERAEMRAENPLTFDAAAYEKTRPTLPPLREFRIKDDNRPYRLTQQQSEKRMNELVAGALAAWEKGIVLSRTPEEKARAYYLKSWGMRVLRLYLQEPEEPEGEGDMSLAFPVKHLPTKAQVVEAADKATTEAPKNPLYWQAKGDVLEEGEAAMDAYLKAAELSPRDANLWYLMYTRTAGTTSVQSKEKWPLALSYLQRAKAIDKGNAWLLYEEAAIQFRYAPYSLTGPSGNRNASEEEKEPFRQAVRNDEARRNGRLAIDRIVSGNEAPRNDAPRYVMSVPDLLMAAWNYRFPYVAQYETFSRLRELARSASGYAQFMAEFENKPEEAERAAWAAVRLGYRMIGDWPVKDDFRAGKTVIQVLVGIAVVRMSYAGIDKVYAALGQTEKQAAARAENEIFMQRVAAYQKAADEYIGQKEYDSY